MPITALFFDLDDTLLGNDTQKFIQPYLRSFAAHVSGVVDPQRFIDRLLAGTQAMLANGNPRRTLEEVFSDTFYRGLGTTADRLAPYINSFYAERFPALRTETTQIPAARETVQWAFESGLQVVVATNALFPRSAILQRLAWAGVSADEFAYSLITTLEFMHFAKPQPEYFAEVLAHTDCRPEEVLMVGNDWSQDITPAAAMGIQTYWIAPRNAPFPANHARPIGAGPLVDDPGRDEVEIAATVHHFGSLDGERIAIPDVRADLRQVPSWAKDHRVGVAGAFKGEHSWARPGPEIHLRGRSADPDDRIPIKARVDGRAPPPALGVGRHGDRQRCPYESAGEEEGYDPRMRQVPL